MVKFDPYLLFLSKKHPQKEMILLQILTQLFQVPYMTLVVHTSFPVKYQERFKVTFQNMQKEQDKYCKIILKSLVYKQSYQQMRQQFNVQNLVQKYPLNQNNYFAMFLCCKIQDLNRQFLIQKYFKVAQILKIQDVKYVEFTCQFYKQELKQKADKKFKYLKEHKNQLKNTLSPFFMWILNVLQKKKRYSQLQLYSKQNQAIPKYDFQQFSSQQWLLYLKNIMLKLKKIDSDPLINIFNQERSEIQNKLQRLIQFPESYINQSLLKSQQLFLRKIYQKIKQLPEYQSVKFQDWSYDYLGRVIFNQQIQQQENQQNSQIIKDQCKNYLHQKKQDKYLSINDQDSENDQNYQQGEYSQSSSAQISSQHSEYKAKVNRQKYEQIQIYISSLSQSNQQVKQNQEQDTQKKEHFQKKFKRIKKELLQQKQATQLKRIKLERQSQKKQKTYQLLFKKQNERQKKKLKIKSATKKNTNIYHFQQWILFLMKKANFYDEQICTQKLNISLKQSKRLIHQKSYTNLFKYYFPKKLEKIIFKKISYFSKDETQLFLLQLIENQNLKRYNKFLKFNSQIHKQYDSQPFIIQRIDLNKRLQRNAFEQKNIYLKNEFLESNKNKNIQCFNYSLENLNSKEIAEIHILIFLLIKNYGLTNPLIQLPLNMTLQQIEEYYKQNMTQINKIGQQLQFFNNASVSLHIENPWLLKFKDNDEQSKSITDALLSMYIKQLNKQEQKKTKKNNFNFNKKKGIEIQKLEDGQIKSNSTFFI